ncbi:MAG: MFS transporter [Acidobacteria bacterium]|nr:MAG: MFS transporter [Acidobacteriota bacterium]
MREIRESADGRSNEAPLGGAERRLFTSMASAQFRWLFVSNTIFFLAMGGQQVLRSWLVFDLTGSELALGLISAVVAVPMLVISPLGGAAADRFDRRALIAAGQAAVVLSEVAILVLLYTGALHFWHLLVLAGIMGSVFPFIMPARQAIVADVVGRRRLTNAMALNMAAVNTTRILGPAAAGFLIGAIGVGPSYGINAGLYLAALAALLVGVRSSRAAAQSTLGVWARVAEGFRYVVRERLVGLLLVFGLLPMFLVMPFQSLLVVFAEDIWEKGPQGLGILSAASGLGGVVGAIYVAWLGNSGGRLRTMLSSSVACGLLLFAFALSPSFLLAVPLVFAASVAVNVYSALNNTAIQVLIPDEVRGRVSSFLMMSFSLPLLGVLPISAVAESVGAPAAVAGASVLAALASVSFYASSPTLRSLDRQLERCAAAAEATPVAGVTAAPGPAPAAPEGPRGG